MMILYNRLDIQNQESINDFHQFIGKHYASRFKDSISEDSISNVIPSSHIYHQSMIKDKVLQYFSESEIKNMNQGALQYGHQQVSYLIIYFILSSYLNIAKNGYFSLKHHLVMS